MRLAQPPPRIGHQFASLVTAQAIAAASAFVMSVLLARQLGPEGFGQFALFVAVAAAFAVPLNWVPSLVVVLGQEDLLRHGNARRSLGAIGVATLAMASLVVLASTASRDLIAGWWPLLTDTTSLLSAFAIISAAISIGLGIIQAEGRFDLYSALLSARAVVPILVLTAVFATRPASVPIAITAILLGQAAAFLPFLIRFLRRLQAPLFDLHWLQVTARQGSAYLFGATQVFLVGYVDIVVLAAIASPVVVGEYGLAARIYQLLTVIAFVPATIALPIVNAYRVASKRAETRAYIDRTVPHLMTAGFIFAGFVSTLGGFAVPLIFGAEFAPAVGPLSILMVALAVVIGRAGVSPILSSYLMIFPAGLAVTAGAVTLIAMAVVLGTRLGPIGIAIAVAFAALVEFGSVMSAISRRFSISWPPRLSIPLAAGIAMILVPPLALPNLAAALALLTFAVVCFVAAVRIGHVFHMDEAAGIGGLFGPGVVGATMGAMARTLAVADR